MLFKVTLAVLLFVSVSSVFGQCRSGCSGGGTRVIYQPPAASTQTRYYDSQPVYQQRYSAPVYTQTEYVSQPQVYETRRVISQPSYQTYYSNPQPVYREEYSSPVVYRQSSSPVIRYETSGSSGSTCRSCQSY